jgi:hypothetical protein
MTRRSRTRGSTDPGVSEPANLIASLKAIKPTINAA